MIDFELDIISEEFRPLFFDLTLEQINDQVSFKTNQGSRRLKQSFVKFFSTPLGTYPELPDFGFNMKAADLSSEVLRTFMLWKTLSEDAEAPEEKILTVKNLEIETVGTVKKVNFSVVLESGEEFSGVINV